MNLRQVMTAPGQISFETVEVPECGPGEVLLKVKRIGICGSDIHVFHDTHPYTSYPVTQGHEVSAEVAAVGEGVTTHRVGDRITLEPQVVCGHCHPCRHGKYNLCSELKVMGFQTTGAAQQYFAVPADRATVLPASMGFDEGAMIEPLAVTVHAARRLAAIEGQNCVVLGAGPIGILMCQTLKALGAASVLVTDVSAGRLALARECGADHVANTLEVDYLDAVLSAFGPDRADLAIDCAGNDTTMEQAIQHARKGTEIMLLAVFAGRADVDLARLNDSELTLGTSMMYRHEDFVDAIALVESGKVRLAPLLSAKFAFTDYLAAYHHIEANREATMKVLVVVDE